MVKKAVKRVYKKRKPKESEPSSFVPDEKPKEPPCDCGEPALPNNHQCYKCSHRS